MDHFLVIEIESIDINIGLDIGIDIDIDSLELKYRVIFSICPCSEILDV